MALPLVRPYVEILAQPRAWRFSLAAWFGRIMRSTAGIGAILLIADRSSNYALAGAVSGCVVLGAAVLSPIWSRAADSRGQGAVLPLAIATALLSATALIAVVHLGAPVWSWFVAAFLVGASSIDAGTLARARWVHLLRSPHDKHTALALESVGDEFTFVIGPPVVTLLAGLVSPAFGLATGVAISVAGLAVLLAQRSTAPVPVHSQHERRRLLPAGIIGLLPGYVGVGLMFGSIDLTAVGVAREAGSQVLAGVLLAVFAIGSVVSGLVFGALSGGWSAIRRVLFASVAFAAVVPLLLLVRDIPSLAIVSFTAGLVTTPVLISGSSLIEIIVDRSEITTAMAWPSVALSLGVTIGATVGGEAINRGGAWAGLLVCGASAALVGGCGILNAALRRPRLPLPERASSS
ncbi:putative MFS family arabinose efflux permease [Salinibacterium sp. CAN_S4]|uniref:MFS transporter n=1 Tax=Salinibacterium sp. CAN_S4 TaxID=2787727 RepID=UPI0018EFF99D